MNKTPEALKLAEEALVKANHFHDYEDALAAIRDALAEPVKQEPVMYLDEKSGEVCRAGWLKFHARENDKDRFTKPLYAAPVDAKAIRAEALEEAAKWCEDEYQKSMNPWLIDYAAAIRGLK